MDYWIHLFYSLCTVIPPPPSDDIKCKETGELLLIILRTETEVGFKLDFFE